MRAVHGIIVELENKQLIYSGVNMTYDFINKSAKTSVFSDLALVSDYNSPLFCPDRGVVTDSDDPKIKVGDTVILDYFSVVRALGTQIEEFQRAPQSTYEQVGDKIRIPVRTHRTPEFYVYAIFRDGEFIPYNDFCIIEQIPETASDKVFTVKFDKVSQKYIEHDTITKCRVLYGTHAGATCLFQPEYVLGEAQHTLIDGREVRFIQEKYLLAQLN